MKWSTSFTLAGLVSLLPQVLVAQAPTISGVQPQAVMPGASVDLAVSGANLVSGPVLWTAFPAESQLAPGVDKNGENAARVVFRVQVPESVSPGIYGIRVGTSNGVSPLQMIMVDDLKSVASSGSNKSLQAALAVELPVAVDGRVDALQMNYFKFQVQAGQRVAFEVLARRFGSALDPMIRLLDVNGRELAYSDDAAGLSGDSQLVHRFEQAGEYVLEVRDIRYEGGAKHLFRLRMGDFPLINVPVPLAVQRGTTTPLTFAGTDVEGVPGRTVAVPADATDEWLVVSARREGGNASGFATLAVSDHPEFLETEPNNALDAANPVGLDASLNGRLAENGDIDFFKFSSKKGQKIIFEAWTRQQGSPADVVLETWKVGGGRLAEVDDNGVLDGRLVFTAPEDGEFAVSVRDLHRRGGTDLAYRIRVSPSQPDFVLAASADHLNVPSGGTAAVTVSVTRQDYAGPIELTCDGLPEGLEAVPTTIGPGRNSVVLTLKSKAGTAGGQLSPARIIGLARVGETELKRAASISAAVQAASNAMPWPNYVLDQASAVGVSPALPYRIRTEPAEVVLGRNLSTSVKVIVERSEGYDEQVELKLNPEKDGVPGGITVAAKPIPKGQNEVVVAISADDKAPMGPFTAVLNATLTKEKTSVVQPVPGITFRVEEPLAVEAPANAEVAKGQKVPLTVTVRRNPALNAELDLTVQNLPAGVTAAAVKLPAGQSEAVIELTAAADASATSVSNLVVVAQGAVGDKKFQGQSSQFSLAVK